MTALDTDTNLVREWIAETYGSKVLPLEIPHIAKDFCDLLRFATVYDGNLQDSKDQTVARARDAYDLFVSHIESSLIKAWGRQLRADGVSARPPAVGG